MQSNKIGLGIIDEKWVYAVAKSIFKAKEDFRIKHVDWNNYSYGNGLDLRVFKRNKQVMGVEVKNWRKMGKPYGTDIIRSEVIDRFTNFAGGIKVLVITFLSLLTKDAMALLKSHNIHILETNKLIGSKDFPRKGRNSKVFYQLKAKLSKLWFGAKFGCSVSRLDNRLDNYTNREHNAPNTNTNSNNINNTKQSNTILTNTIPITKNYTRNYALELVKSLLKLSHTNKLDKCKG